MTPTLKEQIEQWIEREAEKYQKEYHFNLNTKLRSYDDIRDSNIAGAHIILPMLVVAVEALQRNCRDNLHSAHYGDKIFQSTSNGLSSLDALNKIKSMMEGNGND